MIERLSRPRWLLWLSLGVLVLYSLTLAGCSREESHVTPAPTQMSSGQTPGTAPSITPVPTSQLPTLHIPVSIPTSTPTPTANIPGSSPSATIGPVTTPTPTPIPSPPPPDNASLPLALLAPQDGIGVEIDHVRVIGKTRPDAIVGVNGVPVEVSATGTFQQDVPLVDGINGIEVKAADLSGGVASEYVIIFFVSPTAGLPLSLFYPYDGLHVDKPEVQVVGGTKQDAVVGVNGSPAAVDIHGIFSATVPLEEGANLIEVVAADASHNVRFQTTTVFYLP